MTTQDETLKPDETLKIVGPRDQFPKVSLMEPAPSGYVLLAAEVDRRPPIGFFLQSGRKTKLIAALKDLAAELRAESAVLDVAVFKALIIPPGRGAFLKERPEVAVAQFDVAMLIEFESVEAARTYAESAAWKRTVAQTVKTSEKVIDIVASNTRRIGPVDHGRNGVFLFNYFYADSRAQNLAVWNYTAGWFQNQTGLDNSTVLLPGEGADVPYTIINHCRWDSLRDILPALLFNNTFRPFVLDNFEANNTAAMPILYQLA